MNYKIKMKKDDFFRIHNRIAANDVNVLKDEVSFKVELGSYNIIKDSGYKYYLEDSFKIKFNYFMKKYHLLIIGLLFFFSLLYINSYRVDEIIFNTETPINNTIKNRIQKQFKSLLWFDFSNINYDQLSYNLQREYSEYPYIDVYSKNNDIYVNIYSHDIDYPSNNIDKNGDIIATRDSIVDEYYIYSGTSNIYKNKFVKKGDILISGKTLNNQLTGSQGLVLGYVYDKVYIEIKKEESILEEGEYQSYYQLSLFDNSFDINKNNNYLISDKTSNNIFNLFDFFSIKKIEEHEKNDIIKRYTRDDAVLEAQNRIINDFNNKRIYELEKITDIVEYNYNETEDLYCFTFIVKKIESIGEFSHY